MYTILNMGWKPHELNELGTYSKAMTIASIQTKMEEEKKQIEEMKRGR